MNAIRKYSFVLGLIAGLIGCWTASAQQVVSDYGNIRATNAAANQPVISPTIRTPYYDDQQTPAATAEQPAYAAGCDSGYQSACAACGSGCDSNVGAFGSCDACGYGTGCGAGCGASGGCGVCGGCGGCDGCGIGNNFFGSLLKRSDHCLDDFISPITNPVFFEDPRNLTEARFIFLNHEVPNAAAGGYVRLYALQVRAKLADNVSLIATKDGYIDSTNPLVRDGWADISLGLKFNLLRDACSGRMLSTGLTYIAPWGSTNSLQGNGDGVFNLFLSGGQRLGSRSHWLTSAGWRLPVDSLANSESLYWSNHLDFQVSRRVYLLTELNWYHWLDSGGGGLPGVEGLDVINLGSLDVTGNDIVTGALGAKFKPNCHSEIGLAWEVPLTDRRDIIENRFTFDWIFRY